MPLKTNRFHPLAVAGLLLGLAAPLAAQDCGFSTVEDPLRQSAACPGGLAFEREPQAELRIIERAGPQPPRAIEVQNGAILIEVEPGSAPTQIRTPHAIAAVRGTTYVVDAGDAETSVFVIEGAVTVRKTTDASTVTLGPGEGVDVRPDAPLAVVEWGDARVADLLARFGR